MNLDRAHRRLGKRWWDDPVQRHAEAGRGHEERWQAVPADRARWAELEEGLIQKVLRKRGPAKESGRGRWFITS